MTTRRRSSGRIQCTHCGKSRPENDYYKINGWSEKSTQRMTVCKQCINEYLNIQDDTDILDKIVIHKFQLLLLELNKPFIYEWYSSMNEEFLNKKAKMGKKNAFAAYYKKVQLVERMKHKTLTWLDSDFSDDGTSLDPKTNIDIKNRSENITNEEREYLIHFWGKGFSDEGYRWLTEEFEDYAARYDLGDSKTLENIVKELCLTQWDIRKAREDGNSVEKLEKTLQDLMGSANLKPVQETGANATDQETFGTLIKKFENEKPIPEPLPEWKDIDGIRNKIQIWFTGHLSKMLGIDNSLTMKYDKEMEKYTVKRPDDDENRDEE